MSKSNQINELLDSIQIRNDLLKELDESGKPYVGIFYNINNELYWEGLPISEVPTINGIKNYSKEHFMYWKFSILKIRPELNKYDYQAFPRGRVIYLEDSKKFEVYCDKCIKEDNSFHYRLNDEMNIPYTTNYFTDGKHYKCSKCRSEVTK